MIYQGSVIFFSGIRIDKERRADVYDIPKFRYDVFAIRESKVTFCYYFLE